MPRCPNRSTGIADARDPGRGCVGQRELRGGLHGLDCRSRSPRGPEPSGDPVGNDTAVTDEHASHGEYAVEFFIDGVADDGTLWVQQPVDLAAVSTIAVDVYSPEESFNTLSKVAVYAGPGHDGLREGDFDTTEAAEDHAGWKTYEYPVDPVSDGLVAVGVSVVWETAVTRWVDNVRLR